MGIISFFNLVEIQTKVASIIPYIVGTAFTLYKFDNFNTKNAILLFLSITNNISNKYSEIRELEEKRNRYEKNNGISIRGVSNTICSRSVW